VNAHTLPLRIASRLSLAFPRAPKRAHSRSLSPRSAFESRHGPPHCMPVLSARSQSRATCAAIAALIRISTAKLLVQSAMHAAATLGRLASTTTRGLHHNGDCCTSSRDAGQVRIRGRLGGAQRSGGVRGRDWRAAGRRGEGEQRFPVGEYGERIVVAAYDDGEGTGDEIKLECDASGCVIVKTTSKTLEEEDDRGGFLCCDLTGWAWRSLGQCWWSELIRTSLSTSEACLLAFVVVSEAVMVEVGGGVVIRIGVCGMW
jgi:hypothetical protein